MGTLAGKRFNNLILKDLNMDQAAFFFEHIQENRDAYDDTIPFVSRTTTLEAMRDVLARNLQRQQEGIAEFYTLWDGERLAGYFLIREKDWDAKWAEIGYMIGREWRGQGISKQVCNLLLEELFINQEMQKVVICCNEDNLASSGLAKKLGFQLEGNIRQHFVVNGKIRNMLYFGLLKDEWMAQQKL
ncbi:MAG: GNAT family N-acetyltransferase [Anaerolineae bacterium]|nr:GNAT family N-acetyltransferase [Anaerolineae bacterium]